MMDSRISKEYPLFIREKPLLNGSADDGFRPSALPLGARDRHCSPRPLYSRCGPPQQRGDFRKRRFLLIVSSFLISLVIAVVVNAVSGIGTIYTHLFYIPIILSGIWYSR